MRSFVALLSSSFEKTNVTSPLLPDLALSGAFMVSEATAMLFSPLNTSKCSVTILSWLFFGLYRVASTVTSALSAAPVPSHRTLILSPGSSQVPFFLASSRRDTPSHVNLPSAYHSGMLNHFPSLPCVDL